MKRKVVVICGPTASGKSALALSLAQHFNGTIISADSMQIYRKMDIGTAKPSLEEQALVPHRMIDICTPFESFSVARFQELAKKDIAECLSEGRTPIVAGGTGLYIDSLLYNTRFADIPENPVLRKQLEKEYEKSGGEVMLRHLEEVDPEQAKKLHPADKKRIVRAWEVYRLTGNTLTSFNRASRSEPSEYNFLTLILSCRDRKILYDRINQRVEIMLRQGLLEETKALLDSGYAEAPTASQAIGYKELFGYLKGECSLEQAVSLLKQRSRNYAKRQMTWFRKYNGHTIQIDSGESLTMAFELTDEFLRG